MWQGRRRSRSPRRSRPRLSRCPPRCLREGVPDPGAGANAAQAVIRHVAPRRGHEPVGRPSLPRSRGQHQAEHQDPRPVSDSPTNGTRLACMWSRQRLLSTVEPSSSAMIGVKGEKGLKAGEQETLEPPGSPPCGTDAACRGSLTSLTLENFCVNSAGNARRCARSQPAEH